MFDIENKKCLFINSLKNYNDKPTFVNRNKKCVMKNNYLPQQKESEDSNIIYILKTLIFSLG